MPDTPTFSVFKDDTTMLTFSQSPRTIVFSPNSKPVLTITPDGRFVLGEGATVDDAAKAICEAAQSIWQRPGFSAEDVSRIESAAIIFDRLGEAEGSPSSGDDLRSIASRIQSLLPEDSGKMHDGR